MKKIHFIAALTLCWLSLFTFGQSDGMLVRSNDAPFPGGELFGAEFMSKVYTTDGEIKNIFHDTVSENVFVKYAQFGGSFKKAKSKGFGFWYSERKDSILWGQKFHVRRSILKPLVGQTLSGLDKERRVYTNSTGKLAYELDHHVSGYSKKYNTYFGQSLFTHELIGSDAQFGEPKWRIPFNQFSIISDIIFHNEDTVYVVGGGLFLVDLKNNSGKFIGERTALNRNQLNGEHVLGALAFGASSGIIGAALLAYFPEVIAGINSNLLIQYDTMYFAGVEHIFAVNRDGVKLWENELTKRKGSQSTLFLNESNILMVNSGTAKFNNELIRIGLPFLKVFSKKTGELLEKMKVKFSKNEVILGHHLEGDLLWVLTNERMILVDLDQMEIKGEEFNEGYSKCIETVGPDQFLIQEENKWVPAITNNNTQWIVRSEHGIVLIEGGRIKKKFKEGECIAVRARIAGYKLAQFGAFLFFIDGKGDVVGRVRGYYHIHLWGKHLYKQIEDKLHAVDLEELLSNATPKNGAAD